MNIVVFFISEAKQFSKALYSKIGLKYSIKPGLAFRQLREGPVTTRIRVPLNTLLL